MFQKYFYQGAIFFVAVFLFFGCASKEIDNPKTTTIPIGICSLQNTSPPTYFTEQEQELHQKEQKKEPCKI